MSVLSGALGSSLCVLCPRSYVGGAWRCGVEYFMFGYFGFARKWVGASAAVACFGVDVHDIPTCLTPERDWTRGH
eukprot:13616966-Alexandrium_andersonii.AAC.1